MVPDFLDVEQHTLTNAVFDRSESHVVVASLEWDRHRPDSCRSRFHDKPTALTAVLVPELPVSLRRRVAGPLPRSADSR
jgi:hypothetical protein